MSWKCQCGAESDPNNKGIIGFVMLDSCFECREIRISPHILHKKSKGNKDYYKESLLAHKYLIPKQ